MNGVLTDVWLALSIAEAAIGAILLVRLARGPSIADRIVATNVMSTQITLSLLFYAAYAHRSIYLDLSLWTAAFSYLATFAWSRLAERELL